MNKSKLYLDRENQYAHEILKNIEQYNVYKTPSLENINKSDCIDDILKNNTEKTSSQVFEEFKTIVKYCKDNNVCISDDKFDEFIDTFTEKCHYFTDEELIESLNYMAFLPATPFIYYKNFMELWLALDEATCARLEKWDLNKVLYVCECWYSFSMARKSEFVWLSLRKFGRKIKKLSKIEMVHSLFFCNLVRKPLIEMFDYEIAWKKHFNEMTIEEISIMSMGFFKTKTKIRSPELADKIYERLINELENVINKPICLVNILKILRYSSGIPQRDIMNHLLEKLCPFIDNFQLVTCLHIALLGCDMQQCHDKCIELIMNRFNRDITEARLKDLERITHAMSLYNISDSSGVKNELCQKIMEEIPKRINEIVLHPQCFAACLHYMTLCGHHNEDFINIVLDQRYMRHAYGRNLMLGREVFCLDSFTRINLAGKYNGTQLTDKNRATMGKLLTNYIPEKNSKYKLNQTDKILLEVKDSCQKIFKFCSIKHILPHFQRPDIVLCYDKSKKEAINLEDSSIEDYTGIILTRENMFNDGIEKENITTIAIVIAGWNNYVRGFERYTGIMEMKLKQLQLLNHKYVVIPWHEWKDLQGRDDRERYLKRKLIPLTELSK
ncbi:uncharacterized protein LOC129605677 [Condylostylus longicornis]|uniref:uncharacterized protein LOC129605677 n=1 Tax=Condylostylus longicornis TaxID=2530218 RepID=UPI00244E41F8|nr:uncharacterized protein LOC129605677 [Condylostylus longicornis]